MNPEINILPKFSGKYIYKSIRLIVLCVFQLIVKTIIILVFFFLERRMGILKLF